jgi:hypothetical protein
MRNNDSRQLPLDLPAPANDIEVSAPTPASTPPVSAEVYSLAERKAECDRNETAKHVADLLKLVKHVK